MTNPDAVPQYMETTADKTSNGLPAKKSFFGKLAHVLDRVLRLFLCLGISLFGISFILGLRSMFSNGLPAKKSGQMEALGHESEFGLPDFSDSGAWVFGDEPWALDVGYVEASHMERHSGNGAVDPDSLQRDQAFLKSLVKLGAIRRTKGNSRGYSLYAGPLNLEVDVHVTESGLDSISRIEFGSQSNGTWASDVRLRRRHVTIDNFPLPLPTNVEISVRRYDSKDRLQFAIAKGAIVDQQLRRTLEASGVTIKSSCDDNLVAEYDGRAFVLWNASPEHRFFFVREIGTVHRSPD